MKTKIIIIGKKSFIGINLKKFLNKRHFVITSSYAAFMNFKSDYLKQFNYVVNCTSNKNYINKKYNIVKDNDVQIAKKLLRENNFIFLSTRKVYKPRYNLKENSKLLPVSHYSRNKLISERKLKEILKKKLVVLRISNLIGYPIKKRKKLHKTFIDRFFELAKKGFLIDSQKIYKDFISVKRLSEIVHYVIKKRLNGIYNVSLGEKIYLNELVEWLNHYNKKKMKYINLNLNSKNESFTLNNTKLIKRIKTTYNKNNLKKDCIKLSKLLFN